MNLKKQPAAELIRRAVFFRKIKGAEAKAIGLIQTGVGINAG
jgi:hypothetical protein